MTDSQRAAFQAQLASAQKDEVLGVLLAVFLGTFGAHHFYLRRTGLGVLYCLLSVTGFSTIAGLIEAFFMPARVRRFNAEQAISIATALGIFSNQSEPPQLAASSRVTCAGCGTATSANLKYCAHCGQPLAP